MCNKFKHLSTTERLSFRIIILRFLHNLSFVSARDEHYLAMGIEVSKLFVGDGMSALPTYLRIAAPKIGSQSAESSGDGPSTSSGLVPRKRKLYESAIKHEDTEDSTEDVTIHHSIGWLVEDNNTADTASTDDEPIQVADK